MRLIIHKDLSKGRYYVYPEVVELSEEDKTKAQKFGYPLITIKYKNGTDIECTLDSASTYEPFGFYDQKAADEYADYLRSTIRTIKYNWDLLRDNWSGNEEI